MTAHVAYSFAELERELERFGARFEHYLLIPHAPTTLRHASPNRRVHDSLSSAGPTENSVGIGSRKISERDDEHDPGFPLRASHNSGRQSSEGGGEDICRATREPETTGGAHRGEHGAGGGAGLLDLSGARRFDPVHHPPRPLRLATIKAAALGGGGGIRRPHYRSGFVGAFSTRNHAVLGRNGESRPARRKPLHAHRVHPSWIEESRDKHARRRGN